MESAGTTTLALLALLGVRPWTGYELTKQARRSLHYLWPSSEAHLYREQRRLVSLGWATIRTEQSGARTRNSYTITRSGRAALRRWLRTEPAPPAIEIEGLLRIFFAEFGTTQDLTRSLDATGAAARRAIDDLAGFAREYLRTGGPFPQRLHSIALTMELVVRTMEQIDQFCGEAKKEVTAWESTRDLGMTPETRRRLQRIVKRRPHAGPAA